MKKIFILLILVSFLSGCSSQGSKGHAKLGAKLPHFEMGYELYTWNLNNEWNFTLITGSERKQNYARIMAKEDIIVDKGWIKVRVIGLNAIKNILSRLPQGEGIVWITEKKSVFSLFDKRSRYNFELPAQDVVDDIKAHCDKLKLQLKFNG